MGGTTNLFNKNSHFQFNMENARGLIPGAKVLVSGVQAGRVTTLAVDPVSGQVRVGVEISSEFRKSIHTNSTVDVAPEGVLGDKVVMISVGTSEAPAAPEGFILASHPSAGIEQLLIKGNKLLNSLSRAADNIEQFTESLTNTKERHRIVQNLSQFLQNLREFSGKLNEGFESRMLRDAFAKLDKILDKIEHGSGTVGALINDPEVYDDLKIFIGEANQNRIMRNLVRKNIVGFPIPRTSSERAGRFIVVQKALDNSKEDGHPPSPPLA